MGYPDYGDESVLTVWLKESAEVKALYSVADGVMLLRNTPLNQAQLNYTMWNGVYWGEMCVCVCVCCLFIQ